jgi:hypothetical protein
MTICTDESLKISISQWAEPDLELAEELAQAYEEQDKRTSVDDDKYAAELDAALDEHCRDMTSADSAARSGSAH